MTISKQRMDVGYVAQLAQIALSDEEKGVFQSQLDQILHYVEQLNELDVSNVEPTAHAIPVFNVFRHDEVGHSLNHESVVANFPASRGGEVLVPKIIDQ